MGRWKLIFQKDNDQCSTAVAQKQKGECSGMAKSKPRSSFYWDSVALFENRCPEAASPQTRRTKPVHAYPKSIFSRGQMHVRGSVHGSWMNYIKANTVPSDFLFDFHILHTKYFQILQKKYFKIPQHEWVGHLNWGKWSVSDRKPHTWQYIWHPHSFWKMPKLSHTGTQSSCKAAVHWKHQFSEDT